MVSGQQNQVRSLKIELVRCWLFVIRRRNVGILARHEPEAKRFLATNYTNKHEWKRLSKCFFENSWKGAGGMNSISPVNTAVTVFGRITIVVDCMSKVGDSLTKISDCMTLL